MSEHRVALRAPSGDLVHLITAPTGSKEAGGARNTLRRLAQDKYGKPWRELWAQGFKVVKL